MYVGFVKQVVDKKRAGRLKVWIPEFAATEDDENGWVLCTYCSPFAGATSWTGNQKDATQFGNTQLSYGFWAVPPDINNEVLVVFPQNDTGQALWVGCLFKEYMNSMVPGVPSHDKNHQTTENIPTAEYNKMDKKVTTPVDPYKRPWHKTKTEGVGQQGLLKDKVRGTNTSSPNRDDVSQVVGILTPGPEDPDNKDSRLGGSSFVMDDGADSEYIALVTRSGAQIRLDETNDLIYIINKPGTAWVQLDAEGNVDVFSAKSMSIRSKEDINMRADKNINIEAGQNINMKAAKDTDAEGNIVGEDAGEGGNITIQGLGNMNTTIKGNVFFTVTDGNLEIDVQTGYKKEHIKGDVEELFDANLVTTVGSNIDTKAGGYIHAEAASDFAFTGTNAVLDPSGNLEIQGDFKCAGKADIGSDALIGGKADVSTDLLVGGNGTFGGAVTCASLITGSMSVGGGAAFSDGELGSRAVGDVVISGSVYATDFIAPSIGLLEVVAHTHAYTWTDPAGAGVTATGITFTGGTGEPGTSPEITPPEPPAPPEPPEVPEATPATAAEVAVTVGKTNVLVDFPDGGGEIPKDYWNRETEEIQTTVARFMTYEPCPEHLNKGE